MSLGGLHVHAHELCFLAIYISYIKFGFLCSFRYLLPSVSNCKAMTGPEPIVRLELITFVVYVLNIQLTKVMYLQIHSKLKPNNYVCHGIKVQQGLIKQW